MEGDKCLQPCWVPCPLAPAHTSTHIPRLREKGGQRIPGDQSQATLCPVEHLSQRARPPYPRHHRLPEPPGPHVGPSSARATQGQCFLFHRIRKKGKCKNQGGHQFPTFSASLTLNSQSPGCSSTEGWAGMGVVHVAWQV